MAPVANCCQAEYSSQVKQDMTLKEFCDYWNKKSGGRSPLTLYKMIKCHSRMSVNT